MTRDEVLVMTPGRELDALVAEKVMGWKVVTPPNVERIHVDKGTGIDYFEPSTDISAAWEVVEKLMKDHRYRVDIICDVNYSVQIMTYEGCEADFHAPTAPEAIVKAALLAVSGV